jgi:uncharacterized damage-inducible protein DinB
MNLAEHYRAMAGYNTWMNRKLYGLAGQLSAEERARDLGAFFRSVEGTLDHLLRADMIWLDRFTGRAARVRGMDQPLYDGFADLDRLRVAVDAEIEAWTASLTDERLAGNLEYRNLKGDPFTHPLWWAASHFFNHQTHHRGQATTLFKQLGHDPGVTDLAVYLRTR